MNSPKKERLDDNSNVDKNEEERNFIHIYVDNFVN